CVGTSSAEFTAVLNFFGHPQGGDTMQEGRRTFLAAGGALALAAAAPKALAEWEPSGRYPDPRIKVIDPSFNRYRLALAKVERIASGMRWCEGPVWFGDGRYLLWSDIPNNRILKWEEETGQVGVYRKPSNFANGHTRDRQGRLVTCEHGGRRITRTEYDGSITVLMDSFGGKWLANRRVLIDAGPGTPDGMRCDIDGNLWCGWGMGSPDLDGVMVFAPDGAPIGRIALPERCANVCFGGLKRNRLFMAASQGL